MAKGRKRTERHIDWTAEPWASFAFHHNKGREDFRILRRALGFTQTRCAEFLGVSKDRGPVGAAQAADAAHGVYAT